ncbi:hypothetical protein [Merismopedia glauca]|uniref:Uncharacterized protein n=1 Tax=Merismopedia glauca CCAP 1448/3 TaxID=1296344 RepID=A0A2T1C3L0_9CYAN|nr:hypothetical protein [Merismopedia glauca]PSB02862.1 hypothetical protein C7B64_11245 [Merismopedia glauca CCAP 1448/3]
MTFLNHKEPLFQKKPQELDFQDLYGSLSFNYQLKGLKLSLGTYTRIDQVFLVWGILCGMMFTTAQFLPISWQTQAMVWSIVTIVGTLAMVLLTRFWVKVERLVWVLYFWVLLMLLGVAVTDLAIFLGWGSVLLNLCPMWLGITGIGYLATGIGTRSRSLGIASLVHFIAIAFLPQVPTLPFLTTGIVMTVTCLVFAQVQWDMRSPIDYAMLTVQQKQFNQLQHQLRQTMSILES